VPSRPGRAHHYGNARDSNHELPQRDPDAGNVHGGASRNLRGNCWILIRRSLAGNARDHIRQDERLLLFRYHETTAFRADRDCGGEAMWPELDVNESRRRFFQFLASSPLLALMNPGRSLAGLADDIPPASSITSLDQALNVFDFERVAQKNLPPAHWGYLATGINDDGTLKANRSGFAKYQIRARRMIDVSKIDMTTQLFGKAWPTPIAIAPIGSQRAFHPEGELATAKAARARDTLLIYSMMSTISIEDVIAARGEPVWYQLYPTSSWEIAKPTVKRAEAAGAPVLVLTVDSPVGRNPETQRRFERLDKRKCANCHEPGWGLVDRKPMFDDVDLTGAGLFFPQMTWDYLRRLRDLTKTKLVLKGIVTREDAALCLKHGVDGIIVSNHGGRSEDSGRGTIESLPEVVEAVGGRIPVLVDGGFRRGTDVFKALALGASAVCIGRPCIWGLAAYGQPGVVKVLDLLRAELELIMGHAGTPSLAQLKRSAIVETPQ
jgi:isopentenyl diphosphate isomerase/L-lactate dehydrogenase-like FMN-dependent dehydrogenase